MSTSAEPEAHAVSPYKSIGSVISSLHSILETLQSSFPVASSSRLHPYQSTDRDTTECKKQVTTELDHVDSSLKSLRSSWSYEREVVGLHHKDEKLGDKFQGRGPGGPDSELERRKAAVLRAMHDWCQNESSLLSTNSMISNLLSLPLHQPTLTPFVHSSTMSNPTERLQAIAVSIPLDVYLNDEDPDLGNATAQPGNARIDTLSLGGERVTIDIDIRHPLWERSVRSDPQHHLSSTADINGKDVQRSQDGWKLMKCDVSYFPLGTDMAEPIVLARMSQILSTCLQSYLEKVNIYQRELLRKDADSLEAMVSGTETIHLQAERLALVFRSNVAQIASLDKRMQKVVFESSLQGGANPATPKALDHAAAMRERNWFVEAEEVGQMLESQAQGDDPLIYLPDHAFIFPQFAVLPLTSPNSTPYYTLEPKVATGLVQTSSETANASSAGQDGDVEMQGSDSSKLDSQWRDWIIKVDPQLLVGQDFFLDDSSNNEQNQSRNGTHMGLEQDWMPGTPGLANAFIHTPASEHSRSQWYSNLPSHIPGLSLTCLSLERSSDLQHSAFLLRRATLLDQAHRSCFKAAMLTKRDESDAVRSTADVDAEMESLMLGQPISTRKSLTVLVRRLWGQLQFEIRSSASRDQAQSRALTLIVMVPESLDGRIQVKAASNGLEVEPDFEEKASLKLSQVQMDVPAWIEWIDEQMMSQ